MSRTDPTSHIEQIAEAKAVVSSKTHSWGDIPIKGGDAEAEFTIANEGTSALKLFNVVTSCTCTTAQIEADGRKSPKFDMHSKSSYVLEVPAGGEAKLKVVFDPAFHGPQGVGVMDRQVKMETNDATRPDLMFVLDGTVI